jgi:hypothetical protein
VYSDAHFAENYAGGPNNIFGSRGGGDTDNSRHATSQTTEWAGNHSHAFDVTSESTGGGQAVSIMPPFYALAYIMRVQ